MQKRKRRASVWAVLLAFTCVISTMSVFKVDAKAEDAVMETSDGRFQYVEDTENGGYMIYDYLLNEDAVEIPAEIKGKPVTSIDQYSFYQKAMTSVTIPDSIKKIGYMAFYECKQLKSVHIPDSVTDLEPYSFGDCYALASFNIPKGITEIPAYAFEWANITSLDIPDNITKIGEGAFGFCKNVTSLTIPDSVTEIGEKAFQSWKGLKSFEVPKNVTKLSGNAFMSSGITTLTVSPENPVYDSRDNCNAVIETDTDKLIIGIYGTKIPEMIRTIGSHAFESSHELSTLEIPVGVTAIEDYAFDECGSLANLTIPKTVKSIGKNLCCQTRWNSDLGHSVTSVSEFLTINCVENSAAHKYAQENGYHFNLISDDDETIYADDLKVTADVDETKLKVGDTFKVTGTVLPENATNKGVNYLSANQDIVTIDSRTGEAKAVGVGKTYVLARSNDGKRTQRFYVTVTKATPTPDPDPTPDPTPDPDPTPTPDVTTRYTTHVQTYGWQGDENNTSKWFTNGRMAGTSGQAKRLEGIKISVSGNVNLGIQYTTHCQSYGWLPWSANGEMNGTEGEAKRLEAIKIQLTGADKEKYDVYYRVHAQSYGWLGWAKNGAPSGTAGYAKRLEGIQIVVLKKGASAPGLNYAGVNAASGVHQAKSYIAKAGSSPVVGNQATSNTNPSVAGERNVNIAYRTHVQTYGWQGWKYNGQMSGTSGQAKRLEGINIKLTNKPYSGSIVYTTHVQTYGWQGNENNQNTWRHDGQMSGTSGEAKRLEAIRINLTGEMAAHYDVYYRVHAQTYGWLNWAKNGEAAGTAGLAKRLEGIQIVLVPKNGKAPATRYQGITSVRTQAYIKK